MENPMRDSEFSNTYKITDSSNIEVTSTKLDKIQQILHIEPENELVFRGPFKDVVTTILKLTNPSDKNVCFKVKTTAPKRYCVRPNCGLILPDESVNVAVMLQPFEYKDSTENKTHKFLVQSIFPTEDVAANDVEALWKNLPNKYPVMNSKLKCIFEVPSPEEITLEKEIETVFIQEKEPSSIPTSALKSASITPATQMHQPAKDVPKEAPVVKQARTPSPTLKEPSAPSKATSQPSASPVKKGPSPVAALPSDLATTDNVHLQLSFIIGLVLALFIGIILGKFVL